MAGPITVGVAGLGRSGWHNHVHAVRALPALFRLAAVADPEAGRRGEAVQETGCRAYASIERLIGDPDVELVVVATPTHLHAAHTITALGAGRMVVCDKPMAANLGEAEAMLETARRSGRVLTVFHNHRFESDFVKVREVAGSGVLGELLTIKLREHRFARRSDWQSLAHLGGGALRNTGSHLIDLGLLLAGGNGERPRILAALARALAPGDAEDHVKLVLRVRAGPVVDIEVSDACAAPEAEWMLIGTRGTLVGTHDRLTWRFVRDHELAPLAVDAGPARDRAYHVDRLTPHEDQWRRTDTERAAVPFYRNLHASVCDHAQPAVTADSAARVMWVVEECFRQAVS